MRAVKPPLHFYRYLYDVIGRDFAWVDRKVMGDDELEAIIHAETTDIRVLYVEGAPAGFFELNSANEDALWLQYLGLVPDFQGRGLGKFLLSEAVAAAWETGPSASGSRPARWTIRARCRSTSASASCPMPARTR